LGVHEHGDRAVGSLDDPAREAAPVEDALHLTAGCAPSYSRRGTGDRPQADSPAGVNAVSGAVSCWHTMGIDHTERTFMAMG
jgi:hypothetical protein